MKKKVFKILRVCLIVALSALVLFTLFLVRILFLPTVSNTKKTEDYGKFKLYDAYEMRSDLLVFPVEIAKDNMVDYRYSYHEYLFDANCQIYLKCSYDEEEYNKEVERLSELKVEAGWGSVNESRLDTENYKYPAYVLSNGQEKTYEYALMDDAHYEIHYILLHDVPGVLVKFDEELLPKESNQKKFNIQMFDVNGVYIIETKSTVEPRKIK